jgi:hypothetical protein
MLLMSYFKSGELNNPIGCSLTVFLFYFPIIEATPSISQPFCGLSGFQVCGQTHFLAFLLAGLRVKSFAGLPANGFAVMRFYLLAGLRAFYLFLSKYWVSAVFTTS